MVRLKPRGALVFASTADCAPKGFKAILGPFTGEIEGMRCYRYYLSDVMAYFIFQLPASSDRKWESAIQQICRDKVILEYWILDSLFLKVEGEVC